MVLGTQLGRGWGVASSRCVGYVTGGGEGKEYILEDVKALQIFCDVSCIMQLSYLSERYRRRAIGFDIILI